eukprot:TRINITY_DN5891_c0_g1_i1.p1 TRINITY_DN5891_c0_g1~~TRINITY_DN5891_c0_g1_i1.p1  ORF type:complete len:130 (+),score=4.92 TRINITY_DN5891_c0_g1_i1:813-1202(+)
MKKTDLTMCGLQRRVTALRWGRNYHISQVVGVLESMLASGCSTVYRQSCSQPFAQRHHPPFGSGSEGVLWADFCLSAGRFGQAAPIVSQCMLAREQGGSEQTAYALVQCRRATPPAASSKMAVARLQQS